MAGQSLIAHKLPVLDGQNNFGNTLMDDLRNSYTEAKEMLPTLPAMEFTYKFDTASFLQYINGRLNLADLQAITGINRHQLSHYATGKSRPSSKTVQRIQEGITRFSEELQKVCLI